MALALYRKYRPKTFAEVIGQEHVTEPLAQALRTGRLHHAYLFSGPRGCGKTSSARILARSLNCERGPTPDPCGECPSCRELAPDGSGSIDVIEIDAASHGGVDDARELRERAFFAPVASRFKVYVIDEAHMVSSAGFNALLKLVEEPPEYVKFVFATTEPEKVLGTIRSRTHHYPFRLIPPGVLRPFLERLCASEGVAVEPAVFPLVVKAGAGSARDCLSVLDQLIAGAGPEGVGYARAVALLGVTDSVLIDELCDSLAAGDGAAVYATVDRMAEAGHDPRRFATDLLERLRDLIVLNQVPDAAAKGLIDAPTDQLERMSVQAAQLGIATLSRFADLVHNGLAAMRGTTAPRLVLELICARMLLPGADGSAEALLQRLERMERRVAVGHPIQPLTAAEPAPAHPLTAAEPAPAHPLTAAERPAAQPEPVRPAATPLAELAIPATPPPAPEDQPDRTPRLDAAGVRRAWDGVLNLLSQRSKRAAAVVREARVREVHGETLVLLFKHSVHADMLSRSPELLLAALREVLGGDWQVRCESGGEAGRSGDPGPVGARAAAAEPLPPARSAPGAPGSSARSSARSSAQGSGGADWPATAIPGGGSAVQPSGSPPLADRQGPAPIAQPIPNSPDLTKQDLTSPNPTKPDPARTDSAAPEIAGLASSPQRGAAAPSGMTRSPTGGSPAPGQPGRPQPAGAQPARLAPAVVSAAAAGSPGAVPEARTARDIAMAAARSAPDRSPRRVPGRAGRPAASTGPVRDRGAWDGAAAEEPPFDPDYDGTDYPGFDPGDAPLDEEDAAPRESSEEQAVRLLTEVFGAERLDHG